MSKPIVIIMGSKSDMPHAEKTLNILKKIKIPYELKILSAHRNSRKLKDYVESLDSSKTKAIIAAAGGAAALPGVVASYTEIPVIGVPVLTRAFKGIDSLLSILQMPKGVSVATMPVGSAGFPNAAIFALQILALDNKNVLKKLASFRKLLRQPLK